LCYRCIEPGPGDKGDDGGTADEVIDVGLFDPAFGFGGFGFEFGDGFDGVAGRDDFGFGGVEFECGIGGACEGAIGFAIETGGDGGEGAGEQVVEVDEEGVEG